MNHNTRSWWGRGRTARSRTGVHASVRQRIERLRARDTEAGDDDRPDLAGGDPEVVFARLFDAHAGALRSYLAGRVGAQVADDLVAETFLLALRRRAAYDPGRGPVRAWLFGIATNLVRSHVRQEVRALRATVRAAREDPGAVPERPDVRVAERIDAQRRTRRLATALAGLARADRDILLLSSWADLTPTEIGQALDMPASTVRSRLHRLRSRLRAAVLDAEATQEGVA
ncbi:RNA polymerase sigma factor [Saccharomonospora piscinae]|nr:RNA polymerase sigma factor [Saccharomonospora piscinae]